MKKYLLAIAMAVFAISGVKAQVAFKSDIHSMNTDAYVLLGNFELEKVEPPKDHRWGRHRPPRRPKEDKPHQHTRTEYDYVQPMLDEFYQVIDCARRIRKEDIRTEEELKAFLSKTPLPVYALDGVIQKIESVEKFDDKGKLTSIGANIHILFNIVDLRTNTKIDQFISTSTGSSVGTDKSVGKAMRSAFKSAENRIVSHLNDLFPTYGSILQIGEVKKDKEAKTVYVDLGAQDAITSSNHFHVYELTEVAGRVMSTKIGKLKVTEVGGADICTCKVTSGGDKILAASKAGKKMAVSSYTGFWE